MRHLQVTRVAQFWPLAVFGLIVWFLWMLFALHVWEPQVPFTPGTAAANIEIPIPPEASNIRMASYHQWIEYAQYLRFEAPVSVCLRWAQKVVPGAALQPANQFDLERSSHTIRPNVFRDFNWFDLDKAINVVTAGGGPGQPQVWVDQARGILYYRKTD